MHTVVLKTSLYQEKPWLAVSFYRAFCRARDIAEQAMYDTNALTVSLPWVIDEVEATRRLFTPRIWDYSVEGSLPTLNALMTYLDEQKLSRCKMKVDELFVPISAPVSSITSAQQEKTERSTILSRRCVGGSRRQSAISAAFARPPAGGSDRCTRSPDRG
jgi:hypothetical protein